MNRLLEFKENIKGKKVGLVGIGVSNLPAIGYLYSLGAKISVYDKDINLLEKYPSLKEYKLEYHLGESYLQEIADLDYLFRSPGVRPFYPEIEAARASGTVITSEIEMLIHLAPCKIVAVTGSDGKTTTTTLISKFLEEAGYKVWLGGNIGKAIFSKIDEIKESDIVVLELSSFQLMTLKESPNISVVTNISPNHLDYHRSYDEYINAKANIFKYQKPGDIVIFNKDDNMTKRYLKEVPKGVNVRYFSLKGNVENGVYLDGKNIVQNVISGDKDIEYVDNVKLLGIHNIANICAGAAAVISETGIQPIRKVITSFNGVEHRMEFVRDRNSVKWYNDSIGTSPSRTIAGLKSFNQKIILIAGGYDKNLEYDVMAPYVLEKVKTLILMGKTAPKIKKAVENEIKQKGANYDIDIVTLNSMEECVDYANSIAKSNDIVVLSPASASFDMYKNFEIRGNHFKDLVNNLK